MGEEIIIDKSKSKEEIYQTISSSVGSLDKK